jgi:hypothetical protein
MLGWRCGSLQRLKALAWGGMGWHEVFRRCHPVVHPRNGKHRPLRGACSLASVFVSFISFRPQSAVLFLLKWIVWDSL